jgi:hypothetical protein
MLATLDPADGWNACPHPRGQLGLG